MVAPVTVILLILESSGQGLRIRITYKYLIVQQMVCAPKAETWCIQLHHYKFCCMHSITHKSNDIELFWSREFVFISNCRQGAILLPRSILNFRESNNSYIISIMWGADTCLIVQDILLRWWVKSSHRNWWILDIEYWIIKAKHLLQIIGVLSMTFFSHA